MKEYKAPNPYTINYNDIVLFLAGSIEQGLAKPWQKELIDSLKQRRYEIDSDIANKIVILNPRRENWDPKLEQDPTEGTEFYKQVTWELNGIETADLHIFVFDEDTKSPITLLELGIVSAYGENIFICCPPKFWRYGNVKIVSDRCDAILVHTLDELIDNIMDYFKSQIK